MIQLTDIKFFDNKKVVSYAINEESELSSLPTEGIALGSICELIGAVTYRVFKFRIDNTGVGSWVEI